MSFKIAFCAGHFLGNPKGVPTYMGLGDIREWSLNNQVAEFFAKDAEQYEGVEILRTDDPSGETFVDIPERTAKANAWGANLYIDMHHNGGISGGTGGGVVAYCYPGSAVGRKYRDAIYEAVISAGGLKGNRSVPLQEKKFDSLSMTNMPAVLIEYGFMDSKTDAQVIVTKEYSEKVAIATMDGIAKVAGLTKKSVEEKEPEKTTTVKNDTKIDSVNEVQKWLNDAYSSGLAEDGIYGPKTKKAVVKALQIELGYTSKDVDGVFGKKTKSSVKPISKGSKGPMVKILQALLVCNGYKSAYVDGCYGTGTEKSVRDYQAKKGLDVDGIAGKATMGSLLGV